MHSYARRLGAYGSTVPAVGLGLWAGLLMARAGATPFSLTPLSLAVAVSAWYGGFGPGLFALVQATLAIDFFLIEPGSWLRFASPAQAAAFAAFVAGWVIFCILADRVFQQMHRYRRLRSAAEGASSQAQRLAQLTAALAQARTPRSAVEAAVQESLHALKADAAMLLFISHDGATADVARAVAYSNVPQRITLSKKGPISDAVGRGAPVIIESRTARAAEYEPVSSQSGSDRFEAAVVVPLLIGSRVVAIVMLEFEAPHTLTPDDHEYVRALGTYAAQALDRTWQFEFALRASETRYRALLARTSRLHALSAALSEAVTLDAVARAVIQHGSVVVGATAGEVTLLVENGTQFQTLYAEPAGRNGSEESRRPVEDGLCESEAVRHAQPVFIKSLKDWQDRCWRSASVAADGGFESSATMPLLVEGAPIGALGFHFTVPVNFDDDYQALLVSVAQHCAQALDRARLYESTQRARADAEKANRLKDEFVSIVSHELRTPLNAILGWTTMLQRGSLAGEKLGRALQSISDNASRQARLIDELLDFSRVVGGRTSLVMEHVDIRELIRGVVESMTPTAVARAIDLQLSSVPPVEVLGDIRRLEQVFFNLIDNALKFTPQGGRVALDVRLVDGGVEVQVKDNGAGIDSEFLPLVFDRFRQADSTSSRAYGGLGLGLSIAKQLVEAHKGAISAESAGKGSGATFTVRLPAAAQRAATLAEPHLGAAATAAIAGVIEPRTIH